MLLVTLVMLIGRALTGRRKVSASLFYVLGCVLASVADGTVLWNGSGREIAFYYINIAVPVVLFACIPGALRHGRGDRSGVSSGSRCGD